MMPPEIRGLCPLIQVFDMSASLAFYRDLLGFDVVYYAPSGDHWDWVKLRRGGAELMLNTMFESDGRPTAPDAARVAGHGDTALYLGAPDMEEMYAYLYSRGVAVERPVVTHYGMRQLHLRDPDGYSVYFQWPAAERPCEPDRAK